LDVDDDLRLARRVHEGQLGDAAARPQTARTVERPAARLPAVPSASLAALPGRRDLGERPRGGQSDPGSPGACAEAAAADAERLAMRAEIGAAPALHDALDGGPAIRAGLSCAIVDEEDVLAPLLYVGDGFGRVF